MHLSIELHEDTVNTIIVAALKEDLRRVKRMKVKHPEDKAFNKELISAMKLYLSYLSIAEDKP